MQQLIIMGLASFNPGFVTIPVPFVKKSINSLNDTGFELAPEVRLLISHPATKNDSGHQ